eukprot:tig00020571_g11494.t1
MRGQPTASCRSRGAGGGKARLALEPVAGFSSGPGRTARAEARRGSRWGSVAASLQVQVARLGRRRGAGRDGARRWLHVRSRAHRAGEGGGETGGARGPGGAGSSGGETGGAPGPGGGFTADPDRAAPGAEAGRAACWGQSAVSRLIQVARGRRGRRRDGRRAEARRRRRSRSRARGTGAGGGEASGAQGPDGVALGRYMVWSSGKVYRPE